MSKVSITYEFEVHEVDFMQEHMMLHGKWFTELLDDIRAVKQLSDAFEDAEPGRSFEIYKQLKEAIDQLDFKRGEYP